VSVGVPALLAARILGKRFFVRVPGDYAWEQATQRFGVSDTIDEFQHKKYGWKTNSLRVLQTIVTKYADTVITPSEYFRKLVIGWGVSSTKVVTIYNGVNLTIEPFKGIVKPAPLTIVSAGRLVPWKGFATLIEVMAQLPNWHLVILGDGPERKVLQGRIDALGLSNRVELLGNVTREEVFAWCRAADVFVLNTSFESFSFQIVEAMAAGVPVITTNTGSLPELITDGKEGVLVNPDDVPALVSSIQSVVKERVGWQQKTSAAIKKSEQFSVEHTADRLSALLK
jgi:glycosyltransferase involved in cell wall biosynthesis